MTASILLSLLQGMGRRPLPFLVEENEVALKRKRKRGTAASILTIVP